MGGDCTAHAAQLKKKKRVRIRIKTAAVPVPLSEGEAREERAAIKMQRAYRRKMFVSMVEKLLLSTRRRGDLLRELVATEKTYVKCLDQLVEQFVVPLSAKLSETEASSGMGMSGGLVLRGGEHTAHRARLGSCSTCSHE